MPSRTLVLHADEYLHHEFLAALRLATADRVHILIVLAPLTAPVAPVSGVITHGGPQGSPLFLVLQSVTHIFIDLKQILYNLIFDFYFSFVI